ncbi:MAG TPA: histidine kinase [Parafilimonas sp.]|nr:histidine kinase [Parafilimonas sp.]
MKFTFPRYTSKDYFIMLWTMVPFSLVLNILIFGRQYFSNWGLFIGATILTTAAACVDFTICGGVAVILKSRFPHDSEVRKRLALMIGIFLIISGLFLYFLFSGYAFIRFYNYSFNQSGFVLAYICMGVLNVFLTFLHEGVSRFERWRANLEETEALKKTVKQSRLLGLKSQVNPHFLFNCLNSLSSLISESTTDAEKFLDEMSKVYRYMLRNDEDLLVPLDKELHFIQSYYSLLKARYGEGIELQLSIREKDKHSLLPPLSLQVILENAFSQNTTQKTSPLKISIQSDDNGDIIVRNNVQRKAVTDAFDYEAGLDNLVSRYRLLNHGQVAITDKEDERVIKLPLINSAATLSL